MPRLIPRSLRTLGTRPREAAIIVAIVSALATWYVWAAINPLPLIQDEYSYVLQSQIFATGHWTAPSPPIPEFFQQAHVLTVPAVASKYAPGHALLMSIGSVVGAPALVPLLLSGLTGALLFLLVRRVASNWVALLAWIVWLGAPISLHFRAAYYSEVTSCAMWMLAWWALLEWRDTRRTRWLLALAAAIGWGAITRPLSTLAFAVPVGVVVIRDVVRYGAWRDFALATALGTLMLGIIPLWSARTTGDWRTTPQTLYTRDYLPYDKPGFGVDSTPPARKLLPVNEDTYRGFYNEHLKHTVANLPRTAYERIRAIARENWGGIRVVLAPFALLGLWSMSAEVLFACLCALALFVGYLSYGHWPLWTLYYFEAMPVFAVLTALGLWRAIEWIGRRAWAPAHVGRVASYAAAALLLLAGYELHDGRRQREVAASYDVALRELIGKLPIPEAIIFVHYGPRVPHTNIVANSPRLAGDSIWIVNDLGDRDKDLMRFAGARIPLAFYEQGARIEIDRSLLAPRSSR
jgi:Dolichyl-phosphate-mannose-protein mannosyltransferase